MFNILPSISLLNILKMYQLISKASLIQGKLQTKDNALVSHRSCPLHRQFVPHLELTFAK
jgi:hypothetical protein